MSLIQQALDKTNSAKLKKPAVLIRPPEAPRATSAIAQTNTPAVSRTYARDPMGAVLEKELTQVQEKYASRRSLLRKAVFGVVAVIAVTALVLLGIYSKNFIVAESRATPQTPVKIYGGYIYRLTGISSIRKKPIAVINNRLVGIGGKVNGRAVVKSIKDGEVFLDIQGKEIVLAL